MISGTSHRFKFRCELNAYLRTLDETEQRINSIPANVRTLDTRPQIDFDALREQARKEFESGAILSVPRCAA